MKVFTLLMTVFLIKVSASDGFAQQVTLHEKQAPLKEIFAEIKRQTGYTVFYRSEHLKNAKPVTVTLDGVSLETAFNRILEGQNLTFAIDEKTVIIKEKDKSILDRIRDAVGTNVQTRPALSQQPLTGRVIDSLGQPIAGATVTARFKRPDGIDGVLRVSTNGSGIFTLRDVPTLATLSISSVGYLPLEISAGQNLAALILKASQSSLDEVQVIAYGSTSRRFSTGNVSTVTSKDIEKSPVTNVLLAMQGRVPGIFIQQSSGLAGSGVKVNIQGQNSVSSGNYPLYVIDGVPYPSQLLGQLSGVQGSSGVANGVGSFSSSLNYLNPDDIESISILKDADATSIYGSRAANGAIIVTTKKGRSGDTRINMNIQHGIEQVSQKMDLMNTQQYLQMRREAFRTDSIDFNDQVTINRIPTYFADVFLWDTTRYTDWQKELIGNTAHYTHAGLSFSGGNNNISYLFGGNYHRETTVMPGDFSDERGGLHFNISNTSKNSRFKIDFSGSYLKDKNQLPREDLTSRALQIAPNAPTLYNANGELNWGIYQGISRFPNPLSYMYRYYNLNTDNLVGNTIISYEVLKGLLIKSSLGYTNIRTKETAFNLDKAVDSIKVSSPSYSRSSSFSNSDIKTWIAEPQLTYDVTAGENFLNVLIGGTFQSTSSYQQSFQASGFASDAVLENIGAATGVNVNGSIASEYRYNAIFGRINYQYNKKYIANLSVRRDGSSRFGGKNQFHNFASAAGAWIFSEENFIKTTFPFISFGKLRLSYGTTGNDQIGDYRYLSLYQDLNLLTPYQNGAAALFPTGLPNPYLQWESVKKLQLGLDFGFIKDRILFYANYSINRSSNQLLTSPVPNITGFGSILENLPATIKNTGWELQLSTKNIQNKNFSWSSNFNITIPKNKLVSFPGIENTSYNSTLIIGESINARRYYNFAGVNPQTGLYQFKKADGTVVDGGIASQLSSDNTDKIFIIHTDPKYYGGFSNIFRYKNLSLDILLQFASQNGRNYKLGMNTPPGQFAADGSNGGNQLVDKINSWQESGDIKSIERFYTGFGTINNPYDALFAFNSAMNSNVAYSTVLYMRLKNVSFSYQLPHSWITLSHIENARLFINAQNLFTFSNYVGLDPETTGLNMPPLRVIAFGLNITL